MNKSILKENPKVTVVIPTYNRAHLIKKSINSVLNQTYKNIEIIIIDDSDDNTQEKVKEINDDRIIYIKNENRMGVSHARNMAIKIARGELIAFQDSDDEWYPDKLEKQINLLLASDQNIAGVYCATELYDANTGETFKIDRQRDNFKEDFVSGSHLPHTPPTQTIMIKKSVLDEVGYFDERMQAMEDTELSMRVTKKYDYVYVNEPLIKVARNHDSLMSNVKNYTQSKEVLLEKHKEFLSPKILFSFCKDIANYYILKKNYSKAKTYVNMSFNYSKNFKTFIQYLSLSLTPNLVDIIYKKKYANGIPHPNFKGKFITDDEVKDY